MRLVIGNAGWVRLSDDQRLRGALYVRLAPDSAGRWRAVEVYADAEGGVPDFSTLPDLIDGLEQYAVLPDVRDGLIARAGLPGPPLDVLASHFAHTFGTRASGWVVDAHRKPGRRAPRRQRPMSPDVRPPLDPPDGGPITDEFLRQIEHAYRAAIARGERKPAIAIRDQLCATGHHVTDHAVRKWIFTARQRGIMPPGQQGKVG